MGLWSFFAPETFFHDFPFEGADWVSTLGLYNEHLMRDFGSAEVGLGTATVIAAWRGSPDSVRHLLWGYIAFGILHLGYHFTTFGFFSAASAASQAIALATFIAIPTALLTALSRAARKETPR
jgi:hypothetical protein